MTPDCLTGRSEIHLTEILAKNFLVHPVAGEAFLELQRRALTDGIDLQPVSIFRSFEQQLKIWNDKFSGIRAILDKNEDHIDITRLSKQKLVDHILTWSALPGTSRHHWGTDFDVIDLKSLPNGYQLKLISAEYGEGGIFSKLNHWLSANINTYSFSRPFDLNRRVKVGFEPWHISYFPISKAAQGELTISVIRSAIDQSDILGKEIILKDLESIFNHYCKF